MLTSSRALLRNFIESFFYEDEYTPGICKVLVLIASVLLLMCVVYTLITFPEVSIDFFIAFFVVNSCYKSYIEPIAAQINNDISIIEDNQVVVVENDHKEEVINVMSGESVEEERIE